MFFGHTQEAINASLKKTSQNDYYVDTAVSSSGNGTSWATAFKTIAEAITATKNKWYCGSARIFIQGGTYAESIYCLGTHAAGRLAFFAYGSAVTLTGFYPASGTSYTIYFSNNQISNLTFSVSSGGSWVIAPSGTTTTYHAIYLSTIPFGYFYNMSISFTGLTATTKNGITCYNSNIAAETIAISSATNAYLGYYSNAHFAALSGSSNTTIYNFNSGSSLRLGTNTITGTTTYTKTAGSFAVDSTGAIIT